MTLGLYNTVTLVATTPVQLLPPGTAHYFFEIYNDGPGHLYISNANTVGANATSFALATGQTITLPVMGGTDVSSGVWVASDQAGTASVAMLPR
jgi:acyl CoA:acetate/3-ketoacid CoA transferase beta subunit